MFRVNSPPQKQQTSPFRLIEGQKTNFSLEELLTNEQQTTDLIINTKQTLTQQLLEKQKAVQNTQIEFSPDEMQTFQLYTLKKLSQTAENAQAQVFLVQQSLAQSSCQQEIQNFAVQLQNKCETANQRCGKLALDFDSMLNSYITEPELQNILQNDWSLQVSQEALNDLFKPQDKNLQIEKLDANLRSVQQITLLEIAKINEKINHQKKTDLESLNSLIESKHHDLDYSQLAQESNDLMEQMKSFENQLSQYA